MTSSAPLSGCAAIRRAAVMYTSTPFLGKEMAPMVELLNDVLQRRTGLSDAAKGLDPKALQSSTMIGVEAIINGAQERTELVARVLAETGFKDLFAGLFNEIVENPAQQRTLKVNGSWTDYDTSTFDASMGVEVNPTLGKGSRYRKADDTAADQTGSANDRSANGPRESDLRVA